MKYEAKAETNAGGSYDSDGLSVSLGSYKPASISTNLPWRSINRLNARAECQSLGAGYDLISNAQWQTIARNIELQGANWTGGSVGSGCLHMGNNANTSCGYDGANPIASSTNPRGIHTLSNGKTVHDLSGNVFEWILDSNLTNYGADASIQAITAATHTTMGTLADGVARSAKTQFGTVGSYSTANSNSGVGHGWVNYSNTGAIFRGGFYTDTVPGGLFHVWLGNGPTSTRTDLGFRCVYTEEDCSGTPAIGTNCPDGTIYAGQFDGGKYFITPGGL